LNFFCGTDIYVDDFINDDKDTAEQDEAGTQLRLSWMQLPDREDGFGQLLAEILERSLNSGGRNLALREPTEHPTMPWFKSGCHLPLTIFRFGEFPAG